MSQRVTGPFEVKVTPQKPDTQIARAANLGRLTIDKRFHGELEAISKGEMLATQTEVKGSAAYVALERVTGTLKGRSGSFVLRSEEHTSELQSQSNLVCRLLLEKKKKKKRQSRQDDINRHR